MDLREMSEGCVEIMMCGRMEAETDGGMEGGRGRITGREDGRLFLSQLFEATGFSCHI